MDSKHAGPHTMMTILSENYHIVGAQSLQPQISRTCVVCQKAYARSAAQQMGHLPPERLQCTPLFAVTGVDYAGPLLCRRGNPRKPTIVKMYACLFVCFSTKATHIELVSDLTSDSFLAAFTRFTARRGCPSTTNFVGANRELKDLQELLMHKDTQVKLQHFASSHPVDLKFSPGCSPHFGGLWESNIKSMKVLLKKIVGPHHLTFEELSTVLVEAEAVLNSHPLLPLDASSPEGFFLLSLQDILSSVGLYGHHHLRLMSTPRSPVSAGGI